MKMKIYLGLLLLFGLQSLSAQNVLKGRVTDKKGNPISGAKVENAKTKEQTTTDMNGDFSLGYSSEVKKVNVYYMGMQTVTKKARPDMVVRMSNTTWWNEKPDEYNWIVSAQGTFPENGFSNAAFGLMVGRVKNIGWYVKGVFHSGQLTDGDYVSYPDDNDIVNRWTTGNNKHGYMAVTAGAVYRLNCPIHAYLGAGYVDRKVAGELADGTYQKNTDASYSGATLDFGLMLKVKWLMVNCGTMMSLSDGCNFIGNVGIGVCF